MKERFKFAILYYAYWVIIFVIQKPIFLLYQFNETKQHGISDWIGTITHGFCMDLSAAGYCSILPILLLIISCFTKSSKWLKPAVNGYSYLLIIFLSILFVSDLFLYKYWGFRIDTTPLFYLRNPKDAMASGTWTEYVAAGISLIIYIYLLYKFYRLFFKKTDSNFSPSYITTLPLLLFSALIFVLIRGGISVSTMNAGFVYFSKSTFLNHAAINPTWNFINSCTKENDFDKQYRFMPEEEAVQLVTLLNTPKDTTNTHTVLLNQQPNIILIIMEGIGSNMIETLGGKSGVAPNLCKYTQEGICFTNFYASSFRTDRGLVAILSGYPAQPTNSLMKYPNKTQNTPILTQKLRQNGYHTAFYYGGDDNFTNLHSYLITADYQTIINNHNFKGNEMSAKWGAYDHVLFNRVKKDLEDVQTPFFKTILTLNSHEPFDVPSHVLDEPYPNSVHYTDSCIGIFIEDLKKQAIWENTLVIILPDHAYRYPFDLDNSDPWRYAIPMIWLGGVIQSPQTITKTCSQIDLASTLLHQLNISADEFSFSHNILDDAYPSYAFYSYIDGFGLITENDTVRYDCGANQVIYSTNNIVLQQGKAYLQKLYDDIANR